jgi:ribonucleotide monophosphatase NagD (HAD superfamily)
MIGDNPKSDIAGGTTCGFETILVKTGVFNPDAPTSLNGNDKLNPATYVVNDLKAAIDLIYEEEGLNK